MTTPTVRTRFSPSPTGDLHAGGLRTALFSFLMARANNGAFVLRIEDTDTTRSEKRYEERITEDLVELGLLPDEGPEIDGEYGPYRQSERNIIYTERALELIKSGHAYRCYCSAERLAELKAKDIKAGRPPRYDGRCSKLTGEVKDEKPVIRFRVPQKSIRFFDSVHGEMSFESSAFGDFVIIGSDGVASYNFAVTIDDALMAITHVIRGDDHLPNTPRQLLLYAALKLTPPEFGHLPLVLAPDSTPLSKRHSHLSIRSLKKNGFLNSAILNATARLGWSPDKETNGSASLMSLKKMTEKFNGKRLSKSPSLFDPAHLLTFNRLAIKEMGSAKLLKAINIEESSATACNALQAIEAVKGNCGTLKEVEELTRPLLAKEIIPAQEAASLLKEEPAKEVISALLKSVKSFTETEINAGLYKEMVEQIKESTGQKGRRLFMPIRCALTGRTDGIELEKIVQLLGVKTIVDRLHKVVQ